MVARFKALSLKEISSFFSSAPKRHRRLAAKRNVRTNTTISIQQLESRAMLSAVTAADIEAVRDQLLDGVSSIHSGVHPGHVAAFGDSAFAVANYPDASNGTLIAASLHGEGKIVAVPDHQMLLMDRWADTGDSTAFYNNTVEWLAGSRDLDTSALDANVVTLSQDNADWLTSQGYTDVSVASTSTLAGDLADADVFVAGWLGHAVSDATLDTIDAFVTDGGGLFIAEYGQGYDWWWAGEVSDAPANRLLREAGIGFGSGFEWYSDAVDVHRATTDVSAREMFDVIENRSDYSLAEKIDAAHVATTVLEALPETHPIFQQTETVLSSLTASINATPATPVTDAFDQAALTWEAGELASTPANEVVAHHTAESVYGTIPADAEAVTQTVAIDLSQAEPLLERHSTGLYAAPGQQVSITVPAAAVDRGLKIRLSNHTDDISGRSTWDRVPSGISRTFSIDNTTTTVAGAFGGNIYLEAPAGTVIGNIDVTISGAIEAPYFVLGEDTNADWIDSIRDNPAPYAELSSGNVIMSLPSSMIRDLENPEELMTYWRDVVYAQDYLAGTHEDRTRAERINIDVQISHGYLHAGYATQGPLVAAPEIVDLAALNESGSWGWFHELGHEHQEGPSTISGDTEVTVNLFTLYAYDAVGVSHERHTATHRIGQTQSLLGNGETYSDGGAFEKLAFYQQIQAAFGWEPFEQFYRSYRDGSDLNAEFGLPSNNQEEIDQWLTRLSVLTGRDLSPHFDAWGFGVTQSARDAVAHLPQWSMIETLSETESVTVAEDRANVSFDLSDNVFGLVGNGDLSFTVVDQPGNGTLLNNGDGMFSFVPALNAGGTETLTVAAVNEQGGRAEIEVTIDTPAPPVSTEGLVLNIDFDDGTAADLASDSDDNSGMVTGGTIADGKIWLDGSGGIVIDKSKAIDARTVKERTVSLTFNANDVGTRQVLFEEGGSAKGLNIYIDNGQFFIGAWDRKNGFDGTFLSTEIEAGREYSVSLVLDGTSTLRDDALKGYLNGELFGSGAAQKIKGHGSGTAFGSTNGKTRFHDGQSKRDQSYGFAGTLDSLQIFNRAIDEDEIWVLFK